LSELTKRIVSGVSMAAVAILCVWVGGALFAALLVVATVIVAWEFWRLVIRITPSWRARLIWALVGAAYIGLAILGLWHTRSAPFHAIFFTVWLLAVVWATDVGAYVFGRLIGGPKIAPSISPSKTWAGLLGGIFCVSIVMNVMFCWPNGKPYYGLEGLLVIGFLWGAPLAILAQAGDFFESWMKRQAGVKDSGRLIPGHGGLFDRVDGLLPVAIVFWPWIGGGLLR
jgi:phosphatidate cytidylyltransferase